MASDTRLDIDLATLGKKGDAVLKRGNPYTGYTVIAASENAAFELSTDGGTYFPRAVGDSWSLSDPCDVLNEGLFCRPVGNAGGIVTLEVGTLGRTRKADAVGLIAAPTLFQGNHGINTAGTSDLVAANAIAQAWRLVRYRMAVSANATLAAAGIFSAKLAGAPLLAGALEHRWYLSNAAPAGAIGALDTGIIDLGPAGIPFLSGASLSVTRSAALATGELSVWIQIARADS